jgi:hypothetical protein
VHTLADLRAGELADIRRLDLAAGLTEFPREIFALADTLEVLNLSGNALSSLPDDLDRLHRLRVIFLSDNQFTRVPDVLGRCRNLEMIGFKANQISELPAAALPERLRWLILTDNRLSALPAELGRCTRLQKLMLAGNRLERLPEEMAACRNLELLRISANRFRSLPDWLATLPRLAWLAYSGNPCSATDEAAALEDLHISPVEWHALELHHALGEGASGVIYRAHHRTADAPVAVKMFKGALTSDGSPRSEKAACIAAGAHPGLIPVVGKVSGHPAAVPGLVMSLIDPSFGNLAGPPSLESCTRDVYPEDARFSLRAVLDLALGIASVVAHLHQRGVMHGDLYAHNILWNRTGDSLLGDFGAASFLPRRDTSHSIALQRLEVRAFACLFEEVLERCTASAPALAGLWQLQRRCADADVAARPLFTEIREALAGMAGQP